MLTKCVECGGMLSDTATFCPHCGFIPKGKKAPIRRHRKKLPNGFGSVKKLKGKRTNPFVAYPPATEWKDNGVAVVPRAIGYFPSYQDAYNALSEYQKNPYDLDARTASFAEVYEAFMAQKFPEGNTLSQASKYSYTAAFKNSSELHGMTFSCLKSADFQRIVDGLQLKHASKELVVNLFKQMSKFALERDMIVKDYAQFVSISSEDDDEKGVPLSLDEIHTLIQTGDSVGIILLYTGMRISELKTVVREDNHFLRGGIKTKAGKNRLIPIHPAIEKMSFDFKDFSPVYYRRKFKKMFPNHTPHDLRHTTIWLMQSHDCDDLSTKMILGHSFGNDIEKNTYGHRTPEQLYSTICKVPDFVTNLSPICY